MKSFWFAVKETVMDALGYLGIFLEIGAGAVWVFMWIKMLADKIDNG